MNTLTIGKIIFISTLLSVISACTGGVSGYAEADGLYFDISVDADLYAEHHGSFSHEETNTKVSLMQFDMIDTYETNSEFESTHLALSPYVNLGYFEVFWNIQSAGNYIIELRINDVPLVDGSELISRESCSEMFPCYDKQYQFCDFSSDFTLTCETPNGSVQSTNIDYLVRVLPQDAYLIMQTCDTFYRYCEYQTLPVLIE